MRWFAGGEKQRTIHDTVGRPKARFEAASGEAEHCTERVEWGASDASPGLRGRSVRHDDPSGTRIVDRCGMHGQPLVETRRFLTSMAPPDWPVDAQQREALLEDRPWTTVHAWLATRQRRGLVDAAGHGRRVAHDVAGRVCTEWLRVDGTAEQAVLLNRVYDAYDTPCCQSSGNGSNTVWERDRASHRLVRVIVAGNGRPATIHQLHYDYDPIGNVVAQRDGPDASGSSTYRYDSLSRLIASTGFEAGNAVDGSEPPAWLPLDDAIATPYEEGYSYDTAGNLIELTHKGAFVATHRSAVAGDSNRSVPAVENEDPDIEAAHDADGQLRTLAADTMVHWNARRQLASLTAPGLSETYTYDASGLRARKVGRDLDTMYLPGLEIRAVRGGGDGWQWIDTLSGVAQAVRVDASPVGTTLRYPSADRIGSRVLELDDEGNVIARERFHPYGTTAARQARDRREAAYTLRHFAGHERDDTGLYDYGLRCYMPWRMRWPNPDPSGGLGGMNRYAMVNGNPASKRDVLGLMASNPDEEEDATPEDSLRGASPDLSIPIAESGRIGQYLRRIVQPGLATAASDFVAATLGMAAQWAFDSAAESALDWAQREQALGDHAVETWRWHLGHAGIQLNVIAYTLARRTLASYGPRAARPTDLPRRRVMAEVALAGLSEGIVYGALLSITGSARHAGVLPPTWGAWLTGPIAVSGAGAVGAAVTGGLPRGELVAGGPMQSPFYPGEDGSDRIALEVISRMTATYGIVRAIGWAETGSAQHAHYLAGMAQFSTHFIGELYRAGFILLVDDIRDGWRARRRLPLLPSRARRYVGDARPFATHPHAMSAEMRESRGAGSPMIHWDVRRRGYASQPVPVPPPFQRSISAPGPSPAAPLPGGARFGNDMALPAAGPRPHSVALGTIGPGSGVPLWYVTEASTHSRASSPVGPAAHLLQVPGRSPSSEDHHRYIDRRHRQDARRHDVEDRRRSRRLEGEADIAGGDTE
ncbi:MAG: RHS repeat-associated core domain-containing protein, partial [Luteibacter sp.]